MARTGAPRIARCQQNVCEECGRPASRSRAVGPSQHHLDDHLRERLSFPVAQHARAAEVAGVAKRVGQPLFTAGCGIAVAVG